MGSTSNVTSRRRRLEMTDDRSRPRGWLVLSVILAAAVVLAFDVSKSPRIAAAVPYVVVVLLALNARNARFVLIVASACTCLTVAGFYASASDRFEAGGRSQTGSWLSWLSGSRQSLAFSDGARTSDDANTRVAEK